MNCLSKATDWLSKERFLIGTSLARISIGFLMLYMYLMHYSQRYYLWGNQGIISNEMTGPTTLYSLSNSNIYFDIIYHIGILLSILFIFGYKTRLVSIINFVFYFSLLERNPMIADGGDNILRVCLFYLLFADMSRHFSIDSNLNNRKKSALRTKITNIFHNIACIATIIQISILYLVSGLYQIIGEMWHNGTAIYYIMQVDQFSRGILTPLISDNTYLIVLFTYLAIIIKIAFPFLLFNKYTKYFIILCIVSFHVGIAYGMGLITFSLTLIVLELIILTDTEYKDIYNKFQHIKAKISQKVKPIFLRIGETKTLKTQKIIVFYDGWCPFCKKSVNNLSKIDIFGMLKFYSFRDEQILTNYKLDIIKVEKRIHSKRVDSDELLEGIHSFIQIVKRIPILWPLVLLMYLANAIGLGQKTYDFIANRRKIIPTGSCTDSCFIPEKTSEKI
ncbi:DCC1-like thiol-disulfide oxidoreductase family protein [Bacillus sp. H1a]|uniref:DCC1-like thiol-disulfide oxidoreductase family protein n=1 Tax=Bacillus sp. H1a TaxID=1397276 RepID=UPI0004680BEC|nr:DCC1-like thiol-disulfide oxidoreductase family protein [Bacillus sp. H1a]